MSDQTGQPKKEYNPTLGLLYNIKNGMWTLPIQPREYDSIMKHVELGGRIVVKINQYKTGEKSPDAYLEFIPKAKLEAREAARAETAKAPSDEI